MKGSGTIGFGTILDPDTFNLKRGGRGQNRAESCGPTSSMRQASPSCIDNDRRPSTVEQACQVEMAPNCSFGEYRPANGPGYQDASLMLIGVDTIYLEAAAWLGDDRGLEWWAAHAASQYA